MSSLVDTNILTRDASPGHNHHTPARTHADIAGFRRVFDFLQDERAIYSNWENLVTHHEISGKAGHDARLVAAIRRHQLTGILTFNGKDFTRFAQINVLEPEEVLRQET